MKILYVLWYRYKDEAFKYGFKKLNIKTTKDQIFKTQSKKTYLIQKKSNIPSDLQLPGQNHPRRPAAVSEAEWRRCQDISGQPNTSRSGCREPLGPLSGAATATAGAPRTEHADEPSSRSGITVVQCTSDVTPIETNVTKTKNRKRTRAGFERLRNDGVLRIMELVEEDREWFSAEVDDDAGRVDRLWIEDLRNSRVWIFVISAMCAFVRRIVWIFWCTRNNRELSGHKA